MQTQRLIFSCDGTLINNNAQIADNRIEDKGKEGTDRERPEDLMDRKQPSKALTKAQQPEDIKASPKRGKRACKVTCDHPCSTNKFVPVFLYHVWSYEDIIIKRLPCIYNHHKLCNHDERLIQYIALLYIYPITTKEPAVMTKLILPKCYR